MTKSRFAKGRFFFSLFLILVSSALSAKTIQVNNKNINITFEVEHFRIVTVEGCFKEITGEMIFDYENKRLTSISGDIEANSISTGIDIRDNNLRAEPYFEVNRFPTLHFDSNKIVYTGNHQFQIVGDMVIKGRNKRITFDGSYFIVSREENKGTRVGHMAKGMVDRLDFDIGPTSVFGTEDFVIGRQVLFTIKTEFCLDENDKEVACLPEEHTSLELCD